MRCEEVREQLLVDEDGSGRVPPRIGAHLESCAACRQFKAEADGAWQMLDAWSGVEPSPDFRARFWQRAAEHEGAGAWWKSGPLASPMRYAAGLVALAVVLVAGTLLLQTPSRTEPVATSELEIADPDDELLLESLSRITKSAPTHSLAMFDTWRVSSDDAGPARPSTVEEPENKTPTKKPSGASDENIG